jgi:hypothetical protein
MPTRDADLEEELKEMGFIGILSPGKPEPAATLCSDSRQPSSKFVQSREVFLADPINVVYAGAPVSI